MALEVSTLGVSIASVIKLYTVILVHSLKILEIL